MKNKLIVLLIVLAAVALGAVSVKKYDQYLANNQTQARLAGIARDKELEARAAEQRGEQAAREELKKQCLVGLTAWDKLPLGTQRTTPAPVC